MQGQYLTPINTSQTLTIYFLIYGHREYDWSNILFSCIIHFLVEFLHKKLQMLYCNVYKM